AFKMITRYKHALIIFTITCALCTCKKKEGCQYFQSISLYFEQVLDTRIDEFQSHRFYYFLPMESCENCIFSNLEMLNKLKIKNLSIIFVGVNFHPEWDVLLTDLKKKHPFHEDPQKRIYSYESNLGKPLLLSVESGNCAYSKTINEKDLETIRIELEEQ
ncbi:MAG: hypothetical protein C0490_26575, partial [Marivirga sp.]|nr:hypothetical protein [Marivirga sp.]